MEAVSAKLAIRALLLLKIGVCDNGWWRLKMELAPVGSATSAR